uniref:Protein kinase domain-containing protein n=1 Tax=Panagrolaimus sp. ES5 TaxID=591445 RepID=A0AC34G7J1_9BILA
MPPTVKDGNYKIGDEVYSLGGILYNMLTSRDPDPGREKEQIQSVTNGLARDLLIELWQSDPDKLPTLQDISGDSIDVLLSDFGLAKKVGNNCNNKQTTCGTAGFMPPTVKDGNYKIGDEVYSLGGILYNMLTSRDPDPGREKEQIQSVTNGLARDLLIELWQSDPDKLPTLQDIEQSPFLNQCRRSGIKRSTSQQHSLTIECKHRLLNDDGSCRKCKIIPKSRKNSQDSAYGSKPPSRNTQGANTKEAASIRNGERSRRPSKTPSVRSHKTDYDKSEKEWPVPPFYNFKKSDQQPIDETRLISVKGR